MRQPFSTDQVVADPVHHGDHAKFLIIGAAFVVVRSLAMERSRDPIFKLGVRQQIARQLFDHELVIRKIAIEGVDHPIAIWPDPGTLAVRLISFGVGIARQIQPHCGPALAVPRRSQQSVHLFFVSIRRESARNAACSS